MMKVRLWARWLPADLIEAVDLFTDLWMPVQPVVDMTLRGVGRSESREYLVYSLVYDNEHRTLHARVKATFREFNTADHCIKTVAKAQELFQQLYAHGWHCGDWYHPDRSWHGGPHP